MITQSRSDVIIIKRKMQYFTNPEGMIRLYNGQCNGLQIPKG